MSNLIPGRIRGAGFPAGLLCVTVLLLAACSEPRPETGPPEVPSEPIRMEPLTEQELMGIPTEDLVLTLPWTGGVVAGDPAEYAPRATLRSVEVSGGAGFDRAVFAFVGDTPLPGYRIAWNDSTLATCEGDAVELTDPWTLLFLFDPASAREENGRPTVAQRSRRPDLPVMRTARQLCDAQGRVVWALGAADSTRFRMVELRNPPRLILDLRHPEATAGGATSPDAGTAGAG